MKKYVKLETAGTVERGSLFNMGKFCFCYTNSFTNKPKH